MSNAIINDTYATNNAEIDWDHYNQFDNKSTVEQHFSARMPKLNRKMREAYDQFVEAHKNLGFVHCHWQDELVEEAGKRLENSHEMLVHYGLWNDYYAAMELETMIEVPKLMREAYIEALKMAAWGTLDENPDRQVAFVDRAQIKADLKTMKDACDQVEEALECFTEDYLND